MSLPPVVAHQDWAAARAELLAEEKALTRARDALAARRRRMPMVRVEKDYAFAGPDGERSLLELFEGRSQLLVYRAFYEPGVENWPQGGCTGCAMFLDQVPELAHLHARDTTFAAVSAAPPAEIARYRRRMGWAFPYLSTQDDFSADFGVPETFGLNVFLRDGDEVHRTYFVTGRGVEALGSVWTFLDLTPLGRQETWEDAPDGRPQGEPYAWWRLHDEYATG